MQAKSSFLLLALIALTAPAVRAGWSGWASLGGSITETPAVANIATDRVEVFARGTDGSLQHIWHHPNRQWSNWESLGGCMTDSPAVINITPSRLEVFVRACNGQLMHIWHQPSGSWSDWASLGGCITSTPAVTKLPNGKYEVFARTCDGTISHIWLNQDGGWSNWESFGVSVLTAWPPSAITAPNGDIYVTAPGGLNPYLKPVRRHLKRTAATQSWTVEDRVMTSQPASPITFGLPVTDQGPIPWYLFDVHAELIGDIVPSFWWEGYSTDRPSVAYRPDGSYAVFTRATSGNLQKCENGYWENLGGAMTNSPAIGYINGLWEIFVRGTDGQLKHIWWNA